MSKTTRTQLLRYGAVPLAVGLALWVRYLVASWLGTESYFLFLWPAVILCAWYGGLGPGLFATLLSACSANYFYIDPLYSLTITNTYQLVVMTVFVAIGFLISFLSERLHRTKESLAQRSVELARQADWLNVILASIDDAILATNAQGDVIFLNDAARSMTGWKDQEVVNRPHQEIFRVISEVPHQPIENPVAAVLQRQGVVRLNDRTILLSKDGTGRPIQGSAAPIRDAAGKLTGVVLAFQDVTERRRGDEARSHLAAIVESSDDAIVSRMLDGTITTWNKGAEQLYGYSAEEMIGKPLALLEPRDQAAELPQAMERLRRGERIEPYETTRICKDGSRVNVSISIAPVKNENERVVGAAIIARRVPHNATTAADRPREA